MNYIDIIIAVPILWGAYKGFKKGLIIEVASITALLLGIYGTIKFSGYTSALLLENSEIQDSYIPVISFAITFIAIVFGVHFIAKLVDKLVAAVALGFINRLFGAIFGIAKFALIISIILMIFEKIDKQAGIIPKDIKASSMFYTPVRTISVSVFPAIQNFDIGEIAGESKIVDKILK